MNWTLALAEIVLACCGMAILVFGVLHKRENTFYFASMLAVGALIVAFILTLGTGHALAFNGQFTSDSFSDFVKLLILMSSGMAIIASLDYNEHQNLRRFEFPVLIVLGTVGMMIMASASNMMTLYLGVELNSLCVYVLAAFARDELRSSEAGLKYFVLGALASGLLLYGISLAYGFSGTMDFDRLAALLTGASAVSAGLVIGVVFIIAGLAFKMSAVPFHMWTPDVYEGAPTPVTLLMGTAPKVAAVALLVRVMVTPFGHLLAQWQSIIIIVSIASMLLGSLAAIGQRSIKRLMAYSSIGHMGYVLIGLAAGTVTGVRGVLIYLICYIFMSAGAFAVIIAMRRSGRYFEHISDLSGLARTNPGLALAMAIFMFSMAGIPPFTGFWAKYFIFAAAIDAHLFYLAVIGVLTSVIGAYYYIRVIKVMYFDAAEEHFDPHPASLSFLAYGCALFTTFFIVLPAPIVGAAEAAAKVVFR